MIKTNQPNAGLSFSPEILLDRNAPKNIPPTAMAEKTNRKLQSMACPRPRSPKNPSKDFDAIIINEVPTACFMGNFAKTTSAGIIRKPPPAPTNPVTNPTISPSTSING